MNDDKITIQRSVDARKRISLAGIAKHDLYLVRQEPNGVIIMEPAVVLTGEERERYLETQSAPATAKPATRGRAR